jgi:hypothetical protein
MTRIRTVGGKITEYIGGTDTYYAKGDIVYHSQSKISFNGEKNGVISKKPKTAPAGMYFKKGWWTDKNDKPITEALIGDTVKFHIQMDKAKVPTGSEINFTLKDWDGALNLDDAIGITSTVKDPKTGTYPKVTSLKTDASGKATLNVTLTDGLVGFINDDGGPEIELYLECSYYDVSDNMPESRDLPDDTKNYLIVYEKEVLITVLVELPHSHYSFGRAAKNFDKNEALSALGLAGHSAMAIGDKYFDYGPDYDLNNNGIVGDIVKISEKDYDYDFNGDGDKNDVVDFQEKRDPTNAPGRPWWGEMVAGRLGIKASDVKLNQVLDFIKLDWFKDGTNIYGEVHKVEFYVRESEANKMIKWWEQRYKNLKLYSVYPWKGEQCTTAVKIAIHQAFPIDGVRNTIAIGTQRPDGLLFDLGFLSSSSKQHYNQDSKNTVIKQEAPDYPKKP